MLTFTSAFASNFNIVSVAILMLMQRIATEPILCILLPLLLLFSKPRTQTLTLSVNRPLIIGQTWPDTVRRCSFQCEAGFTGICCIKRLHIIDFFFNGVELSLNAVKLGSDKSLKRKGNGGSRISYMGLHQPIFWQRIF